MYGSCVAQFLKLFANQIECVPVSIATRALGGSVNHFSTPESVVRNRPRSTTSPIFVERAVMAPDIPKIDSDRHLNLGDAAWNFRDEVLPWLFIAIVSP